MFALLSACHWPDALCLTTSCTTRMRLVTKLGKIISCSTSVGLGVESYSVLVGRLVAEQTRTTKNNQEQPRTRNKDKIHRYEELFVIAKIMY
jgi:hypothetical protein